MLYNHYVGYFAAAENRKCVQIYLEAKQMKDMYYLTRVVKKVKEREFSEIEFTDIFPLNEIKDDGVKDLLQLTGIYLGAIIFAILLIFALGWVPVLGIIIKILSTIIIIYSTVGLFGGLLNYLKYN